MPGLAGRRQDPRRTGRGGQSLVEGGETGAVADRSTVVDVLEHIWIATFYSTASAS
jgi:hypothetical protein